MKKVFLFALLTAIALSFSSYRLFSADVPYPPKNVSAEFTFEKNTPGVILKWEADERDPQAEYFYIYAAYEHSDDPNAFKILTKVPAKQNVKEFYYFIPLNGYGKYSFYLTALAFKGRDILESDPSEIVKVEAKFKAMVSIASKPKTEAYVGMMYNYQVVATTNVRCPVNFEFVSEVPDGMDIDKEKGMIKWMPKEEGEYDIAVRAYSTCEEDAYEIQKFVIKVKQGKDFVVLEVSDMFPMVLNLGESVTVKLSAYSNVKCPIKFQLMTNNAEVRLDPDQGILLITAKTPGVITFGIKAYLECNEKVFDIKQFAVKVIGEVKPCAYISGECFYNDNTPVDYGVVSAWLTDKNEKVPPVIRTEVRNGGYQMELPEGKYYLTIEGKDFYKEWYEDAKTMKEATIIGIECDNRYQFDFIVEKIPQPKKYIVTGSVLDEDTKEPILAMVEFLAVETLYNQKNSNVGRFATKTDEKGNYKIELPNTFTYIAQAVSMMNSIWYETEFYDGVQSPMEADIIELTKNIDNINFLLKRIDINTNGFAGQVKNENGDGIKSFMIAYLVEPEDDDFKVKDYKRTVETNDNGEFYFNNLVYGKYVILSIPMDRMYLPGYYNQNGIVVQKWRESTLIGVGENMIDMVFEFIHQEREGRGGIMKVEGKVINRGGFIGKADGVLESGAPLPGAFVFVKDDNGLIADFGFSNSEGSFSLAELGQGEYKLTADLVGFDSYEGSIDSDYEKGEISAVTIMLSQQPSSVDEFTPVSELTVYPQPASSVINIAFESKSDNANVQIINSLGTVVRTMNAKTNSGSTKLHIEIGMLPAGAYLVRIVSGTSVYVSPMSIVR